jgi:hypothetical protein
MMYNRFMRIALTVAARHSGRPACGLGRSNGHALRDGQYVTAVPPRLGISVNRKTKDLIMDASFTNIRGADGTQVPRDQLKVGTGVHVVYLQSALLGSSRVTEVDIVFSGGTPLPIPLH